MPRETCFRHRQKEATYRCQRCSKPVCDRCTFNARFCSRECNEQYSSFIERYDGVVKNPGAGAGKLLLALLLMIAAAAAVWFARSRGLL